MLENPNIAVRTLSKQKEMARMNDKATLLHVPPLTICPPAISFENTYRIKLTAPFEKEIDTCINNPV